MNPKKIEIVVINDCHQVDVLVGKIPIESSTHLNVEMLCFQKPTNSRKFLLQEALEAIEEAGFQAPARCRDRTIEPGFGSEDCTVLKATLW